MKKLNPCEIALEIIDTEEEPEGPMPDEAWERLRDNRAAIEEFVRAAIRGTKDSIKKRYLDHYAFQTIH